MRARALLLVLLAACGSVAPILGPDAGDASSDAQDDAGDAAPLACDDTPDDAAIVLEAGSLPGQGGCPVGACAFIEAGYAPTLCDGRRVLCGLCPHDAGAE